MHRKIYEAVQAKNGTKASWSYVYKEGALVEAKDPLSRVHVYKRDSYGRVTQERVGYWTRSYAYDTRGHLILAEQTQEVDPTFLPSFFYSIQEQSKVERAYDPEGRLSQEIIYLNGLVHQKTLQSFSAKQRLLKVGKHERIFSYQNKRISRIEAKNLAISYDYTLNGDLKTTTTPYHKTSYHYNQTGLPIQIDTEFQEGLYEELLSWDRSHKLVSYRSPLLQKDFSYTEGGFLQTAGEEEYQFDFGSPGPGVRTKTSSSHVRRLDSFDRVIEEVQGEELLCTTYDTLGQVTSQGSQQFVFDPFGQLIKITEPNQSHEISYDALGRRLAIRTFSYFGQVATTDFLYDPAKEFQEIGVRCQGKTFWKIQGPSSCDAVLEEKEGAVVLFYNGLRQQAALLTAKGSFYTKDFPKSYGPVEPSKVQDLFSFAKSLSWHSKGQDPTGLIWMGARYYDPKIGRFLSQDPVGYPLCQDLYSYANADPVNFMDPDGRFFSPVYQGPPLQSFSNEVVLPYCMKHFKIDSMRYTINSKALPQGRISFINGIKYHFEDSLNASLLVSNYAGGAKVHGIHNATHGAWDLFQCKKGFQGFLFSPAKMLKEDWEQFHQDNLKKPNAKLLTICYSGGCIETDNALLTSPKEVRDRVIVIAIAPGRIISNKICFKSVNYVSKGWDPVPFLHWENLFLLKQLTFLDRHPDAPAVMDHSFSSPTFQKALKWQIQTYIKEYGN